MPDAGFFALALDPDKKPVKSIASEPGSCLAYGIIDEDRAQAVMKRIMAPDMFSGWGVRTLSSDHSAYNPLAYRLGTVWPVANGNICFGLKRYGFDGVFHQVAKAIFDAAEIFDYGRLPEVYGGHPRDQRHPHPGIYPGSCSPQAWSASAVIQICHAMTGVMPSAPIGTLIIDPAFPEWMPSLTLHELQIGEKRLSILFQRDGSGITDHRVIGDAAGLRLHRVEPLAASPGADRLALATAALSKNA